MSIRCSNAAFWRSTIPISRSINNWFASGPKSPDSSRLLSTGPKSKPLTISPDARPDVRALYRSPLAWAISTPLSAICMNAFWVCASHPDTAASVPASNSIAKNTQYALIGPVLHE